MRHWFRVCVVGLSLGVLACAAFCGGCYLAVPSGALSSASMVHGFGPIEGPVLADAGSPSAVCNVNFDPVSGAEAVTCAVSGFAGAGAGVIGDVLVVPGSGAESDDNGYDNVDAVTLQVPTGGGSGALEAECTADDGSGCDALQPGSFVGDISSGFSVVELEDCSDSFGDVGALYSTELGCVDGVSLGTVTAVSGMPDGDYPAAPVLSDDSGSGTSYASGIALLGSYGAGFGTAVVGFVGDVWPMILGLFMLGLGWVIFRRFGRQIASFFGR